MPAAPCIHPVCQRVSSVPAIGRAARAAPARIPGRRPEPGEGRPDDEAGDAGPATIHAATTTMKPSDDPLRERQVSVAELRSIMHVMHRFHGVVALDPDNPDLDPTREETLHAVVNGVVVACQQHIDVPIEITEVSGGGKRA